ncbi:MAG: homocysteine S-methyltransferase family protein [Bacillota bacterium]|nr:homocysteine S-methyltransferase family protein [Bacillota bacterium]
MKKFLQAAVKYVQGGTVVPIERKVKSVEFREFLNNKIVLFDGAMGTMLQQNGLKTGELPEKFNITHPEVVTHIHQEYIKAGSDVVTTNTFGANALKLSIENLSVEKVITSAVQCAKKSGAKYVALDIGPLGELLEPMGTLTFERAYKLFSEQVTAGAAAGADLIIIETQSDILEAKAAILAAKENSDLPVICTMSYEEGGRTFIGTDAVTATISLCSLGIDAVGVNCSLGPKEMLPVVDTILKYANVPVIVQPNAGIPRNENEHTVYDISPEEFASYISIMIDNGVSMVGGCCGTTSQFIADLAALTNRKPAKIKKNLIPAVTSSLKTVLLSGKTTVIGERINPTGKKKLKQALKENDFDYIANEAINQTNAGANVLDVNVGLPEINEPETMKHAVKEIQAVSSLPLQIDSSDINTIEAGVRVCRGRPIINSVNGKKAVMERVFPIVKKYGTMVVGLTLDEKGIPETAEGRLKIAENIISTAAEYGIPKDSIVIDCLVLTASAQQSQVMETLKAIKLVKQKLGVLTVLGVSNVSFGLPSRPLINSTFLAAALGAGLDAPIINPLSSEIMSVIDTFRVLNYEDKDAASFINKYSGENNALIKTEMLSNISLYDIILQGRKDEAQKAVRELLKTDAPLDIINKIFVPALNHVGSAFEKGELFLPQLIRSAETVKNAFEIIRDNMNLAECGTSKGKVILATVKGDIHDIGKNIVKMLLQSYNYEVIDLGKDVEISTIIDEAKKNDIRLIGLSALMTTTVKSMKETIESLHIYKIPCKTMVGGAVLTPEYADMVGADFYAKDAMDAVKITESVFN